MEAGVPGVAAAAVTPITGSKERVNGESTVQLPAIALSDLDSAIFDTELPPKVASATFSKPQFGSQGAAHVNARSWAGFIKLYGWMGVPMFVIFVLSALWTIMLAVIQAMPTEVANYVMNSGDLDRGDFWLLTKPDDGIVITAIVLLLLFAFGYLWLVAVMLFPDKLVHTEHPSCGHDTRGRGILSVFSWATTTPKGDRVTGDTASQKPTPEQQQSRGIRTPAGFTWARIRHEITSPYGILRQYYNPLLDGPKLIFQTSTLFTYLHHGFPLLVIFVYSCLLFINWMISSYRYKRERPDPHLIVGRVFYSFDLFFAVFAPLEVLTFAYYTFNFDRALFATRVATLSAGSFDRTARLFADPQQVSLFRIAFHYLQFTDGPSLGIKSALNALSLFKWWRSIVHLVEHSRMTPSARRSIKLDSTEKMERANLTRRRQIQNGIIASLFFCAGCAVFIHSIVAVTSSQSLCEPFAQCKVIRYQWNVGAKHCSCIVFVDREQKLKSIAEWENPEDTTANLMELATTGHLQIVQIINRQLPTLPDELRSCHHLEQLILIYTKTLAFPDWASEFSRLEYMHIEGDFTSKQLSYLPHDLFRHMPSLMFLHLGCLMKLQTIPDLSKLHKLQYLVMAVMHSVTEIPPLENLKNLKRLNIIDMVQVYSLPSALALTTLDTFALTSRNPVCCNGFITGTCDLTDFSCLDRTAVGEPLVNCTDARIAPDDYTKLVETDGIVCEKNLTFDLKNVKPTLANTDASCGGVSYKQCALNGNAGMCYPARMQPVSCQLSTNYQKMRRLEIERGVGDPCDPAVENWLGCQA